MSPNPSYVEYVWTSEGELIPRGPIGQRSVVTSPMGRIINLDTEGLPVTKGPKPQVIRLPSLVEQPSAAEPVNAVAAPSEETTAVLEERVRQHENEDFYARFTREGLVLTHDDKMYVESLLLHDEHLLA